MLEGVGGLFWQEAILEGTLLTVQTVYLIQALDIIDADLSTLRI